MGPDETNAWILAKYQVKANGLPIEIAGIDRNGLADLFASLGFAYGAEVGVERGQFSRVLCKRIPDLRLLCVDAWRPYTGYREVLTQERMDQFYEETKARVAPWDATLVRKYSLEAAEDLQDHSLDFVYIDANHAFEFVAADLAAWSRKVRPGGIVSGHDYMEYANRQTPLHVFYVVNAWTAAHKIAPWFVVGAKEKREGEARDRVRSWFWVNR